ncbi:MAG: CBS domain-containing protein [Chloroflexi bacterium]|nr:CBS domain-containing protein [Chloroflexota bacterium]
MRLCRITPIQVYFSGEVLPPGAINGKIETYPVGGRVAMLARDIMTSPVVTIGPDSTVEEAATLMLRRHVSCLVVVDDHGGIEGILTHSDFGLQRKMLPLTDNLYQLLGSWADPKTVEEIALKVRSRKVREVMIRDVVTVKEDASVPQVVETMLRHEVNRLPVVREGHVVGIITRHDLLKLIAAEGGSAA